jgi:fructose-bisphosphate aldolase, class II
VKIRGAKTRLCYNYTMKSLYQFLEEADKNYTAIGHFNISDIAAFNAIIDSAMELGLPVMVGVSEGEREFVGIHQAVALVRAARESLGLPVFLNADHTHSIEKAREAAEAGFDEIIFDGSKLPFEENVKLTKQAVDMIKGINPDIIVEGEIGYIGSSSEIVENVPPESLTLTTPEEAQEFVKATGIDILAPAVGNMHGLLASMITPVSPMKSDVPLKETAGPTHKRLNIVRVGEIKKAIGGKFMTLHGGSGTLDEDFVAVIKAGMTIIHVSTELRIAWRRGVEKALFENPKEVAPYKILPGAVNGIKEIVKQRLKLFSSI